VFPGGLASQTTPLASWKTNNKAGARETYEAETRETDNVRIRETDKAGTREAVTCNEAQTALLWLGSGALSRADTRRAMGNHID